MIPANHAAAEAYNCDQLGHISSDWRMLALLEYLEELGITPFLNYQDGDGRYAGSGDMVAQYNWPEGN